MCMDRVHLRVVDATSVVAAHGHGRAGAGPWLLPGETRAASMAWGVKCKLVLLLRKKTEKTERSWSWSSEFRP